MWFDPTTHPLMTWLNAFPPDWAGKPILEWDDRFPEYGHPDNVRPFVTECVYSQGDLRADAVIGQNEHYAGQTWLEAMNDPQYKPGKIHSCLYQLTQNPTYYSDDKHKDIKFSTYDDVNWYTVGGGNHRTVVGKFALAKVLAEMGQAPFFRNVELTAFKVDWETWNIWRALEKLIKDKALKISVRVFHVDLDEQFAGGRQIMVSEPGFMVSDYRFSRVNGDFAHLTPEQFRMFAEWTLDRGGLPTRMDRTLQALAWLIRSELHALYYPGAPRKHGRVGSHGHAERRRKQYHAEKART